MNELVNNKEAKLNENESIDKFKRNREGFIQ